jgi:hypothetical protein
MAYLARRPRATSSTPPKPIAGGRIVTTWSRSCVRWGRIRRVGRRWWARLGTPARRVALGCIGGPFLRPVVVKAGIRRRARRVRMAVMVRPVRRLTSLSPIVPSNAISQGSHRRPLGGRIPKRRIASLIFRRCSGLRGRRRATASAARALGCIGLPRREAAFFAFASGVLAPAMARRRTSGAPSTSRARRPRRREVPSVIGPTPSACRQALTVCGVTPHQWQMAEADSRRTARTRSPQKIKARVRFTSVTGQGMRPGEMRLTGTHPRISQTSYRPRQQRGAR